MTCCSAAHVAAAYGATHLFAPEFTDAEQEAAPLELATPEPWAYDESLEVWRPTAKIDPDHVRTEPTDAELAEMLDRGEEIPDWFTTPAVAQELRRAHPPRHGRGVTVFFTGLSGSGKSTIARGLADALLERGGRTVTLLDGDVVRRLLSAGPDVLPRGPRPQHPPHRLRRGRDHPARRRGDLRAHRPVRQHARRGAPHGAGGAATSCSSTSPRRWRSASAATARACTPRRARAV